MPHPWTAGPIASSILTLAITYILIDRIISTAPLPNYVDPSITDNTKSPCRFRFLNPHLFVRAGFSSVQMSLPRCSKPCGGLASCCAYPVLSTRSVTAFRSWGIAKSYTAREYHSYRRRLDRRPAGEATLVSGTGTTISHASSPSNHHRTFSLLTRSKPQYLEHIPLNAVEKVTTAIGSGVMAFMNPRRGGE